MIIIDMSQLLYAAVHSDPDFLKTYDEGLLRHMIIGSIRYYRQMFKKDYGEVFLSFDGKNSWRKQKFPYYKASRAKGREESDINWTKVYAAFEIIQNEIKAYLPYDYVHLDDAESDDIVAVMARHVTNQTEFSDFLQAPVDASQKVMIVSSDKDFKQLHGPRIKQYSPAQKKFVTVDNPAEFLKEQIIRGDSGDGIPTAISPGDVFVTKTRQQPMTKPRYEEIYKTGTTTDPKVTHRDKVPEFLQRNRELIDFNFIPQELQDKIRMSVMRTGAKRSDLITYFSKSRMKLMLDSIADF